MDAMDGVATQWARWERNGRGGNAMGAMEAQWMG